MPVGGADLVSLKQNVDTTLPAGRLTFQVLGAEAEFATRVAREREAPGESEGGDSAGPENWKAHRETGNAQVP